MNLNNDLESTFIDSFDLNLFFMDKANFWNSDTYE